MTTTINGHLMPDTPVDVETVYALRRDRLEHPDGDFDHAGRWIPSREEWCACCAAVPTPSRAHPYSQLVHCRTRPHVKTLQKRRAREAEATADPDALRCEGCGALLQMCECSSHAVYSDIADGLATAERGVHRTIVCLCGSTRFLAAFRDANLRETLSGRIVLSIGCDMRSDAELFGPMSDAGRQMVKDRLDALHLDKIELADEILVLNVDGYVGESTRRELAHARSLGKVVRWLEPDKAVQG